MNVTLCPQTAFSVLNTPIDIVVPNIHDDGMYGNECGFILMSSTNKQSKALLCVYVTEKLPFLLGGGGPFKFYCILLHCFLYNVL